MQTYNEAHDPVNLYIKLAGCSPSKQHSSMPRIREPGWPKDPKLAPILAFAGTNDVQVAGSSKLE